MSFAKKVVLLVLVCTLLAAAPLMAKETAVIKVQNIEPLQAMWQLGFVSQEDYMGSKNVTWYSTDARNKPASFLPSGIDVVTPYPADKALIVYGDKSVIEKMSSAVRALDVKPKQVQIKAEFIELTEEQEKQIGAGSSGGNAQNSFTVASADAETIKKIREGMIGTVVNTPIISTLANVPASIQIGKTIPDNAPADTPTYSSLLVLPRINSDGSITMYLEASMENANPATDVKNPEVTRQKVRTNRRVANGESILIGGFRHNQNSLIIIATATVTD